ncbi:MAG: TatD family hydrolase [Sedimentisphaerales bacterium]|nr:TatD family hydrolase [Sedimentisphaerales bacterium]
MNDTMSLVDTHTHLALNEYADTLDDVLNRSRQAGVDTWMVIGTSLDESAAGIELCKKHPGMYAGAGIHPHEAGKQEKGWLEKLRHLTGEDRVMAIGEIGLDYYYEFSDRYRQRQVFRQQLELAGQMGLPVIIHCRSAMDECLAILDEWQRDDIPVVFHCFGEGPDLAQQILDRGYFISFTGLITFDNARQVQKTAQYVPLEQIMLETDCPYMSPHPKRNVKPNEPAFIVHIAEKLAQLKGLTLEEIAQATTQNSRLFFGIG